MGRNLRFNCRQKFQIIFLGLILLATHNIVFAQCGLSAFKEPAANLNPTTTWQNVNVGSGTYSDFNIIAGNIYSFRYQSPSSSTYTWDMTLSNSSATLPYNNSTMPIRDPWTGGECPPNARPQSAEWYSTFNGTVRVNTKAWNGICNDYVSGLGSAILQYKTCTATPDPGVGVNVWNVEAFVTTDLNIPNSNARYGYYVDNNTNINTAASWASSSSPSSAPGWTGCEVPADNFTVRARRTGFPCGLYNLQLNASDDNVRVLVNGVQIYTAPCCINTPISIGNAAGYVLGATDNIEVLMSGTCAGDVVDLQLIPQTVPLVNGGAIGGLPNNTNLCVGQIAGNFTNTLSASGGTSGLNNGGSLNYDWEVSLDNGANWNSIGVNTANWNSLDTVPIGGTFTIRRRVFDKCGNEGFSNIITLFGRPLPNGGLSPNSQTICPGSTASLVLNFTSGSAPFNVTFTDGLNTYTSSGKYNGDTIQVVPSANTIYSLTQLVDSFGCVRTAGFDSAAQVLLLPQINIPSVTSTNISCFGGSNGTITVNANGSQPPLSYSIDNGVTFQPLSQFTGLTAGGYTVVVGDGFGCQTAYATNPVILTQPTDVVNSSTVVDASCANVFDGTITVTASGGVSPYSYSLNGGPTQPGNVFSGIGAGNYLISVFDANGCLDTSSNSIANTYIISVDTVSQTNVSCAGGADGAVAVFVNGGIPSYSYSINGITFQPSGTFTGLAAGGYTIVGRDSKGCTEFVNVTIGQPGLLTATVDSVSDILCSGSATGSIFITPSGGTAPYTFVWSNGATSEDITGVGAGIYNVTVQDSKGCVASAGVTLSQPLPLFLTVAAFNNLACSNDFSGAIDVTVNGGKPAYTFVWSNGSTFEDVFGLQAGNYSVTVTDANGCSSSIAQTLTAPSPLSSSITGTNVTCVGSSNGSIDLTVNGGTTNYNYFWSNGATTQDLTNVSGGLYTVIITDANGCSTSNNYTVAEPTAIVLNLISTNILCNGQATGAVDLTVVGGVATYTFNWSNGASTEDISGLNAGTYSLTLTDGNSCLATATTTLTQPSAVVLNATVQNVGCFGGGNGAVDITVNGGVFPYNFNWTTSATTEDVFGLSGGNYSVTITDANSCTLSQSYTITEPTALTSSIVSTPVTCFGAANGAANLTVSGGTTPYTYLWSTFQGSEDIANLSGGLYFVIITDANNCERRDSILIVEPSALQLAIVGTDVSCFNANDGSIDLTVSGATPAYTYAWSNAATTEDLSALLGGQYVVTVTDANLCTATASATIVNPSQITANFVVQNPACNSGTNGAIDLIPSGGVPGYTYTWSNLVNTEDLSGVGAGVYTVTITDSKNCTASASTTVTEPQPLVTSGYVTNVTCAGFQDGFIDITAYGGTLPYSFNWSTSQSTEDIAAVPGGNYSVTVTDAKGCEVASIYIVLEPAPLALSLTKTDATCFGGSNGSVTANISGGRTPYQALWTTFDTAKVVNNLTAGLYSVLVTDSSGCTIYGNVTINEPTDITATSVVVDATCGNTSNGSISITAAGGTPSYTYSWSVSGQTGSSITGLGGGTYSVTITDANACQKVLPPFTVSQPDSIYTNVSVSNPGCFGSNNGFTSVVVQGGAIPYLYNWNSSPAQSGAMATNLIAGSYIVTITDANGCTLTANATLNNPPAIAVTVTPEAAKCYNTATGKVTVSVTGGLAPFTYSLNGVAQPSNEFTGLAPGDYIVVVRDANACEGSQVFTITAPNEIFVELSAPQQVILQGMTTQLFASPTSTTPIINYYWGPTDTLFNFSACGDPANCNNPFVTPYFTTTFTVAAMNADSCFAYDTITVEVQVQPSAFIPTAFTPNNDNLNDRFEFDILGVKKIDIAIFDRWGDKIYENQNQTNGITNADGWDGTVNGKPAPFDTYVYQMNLTYFDDVVKQITGTVTLLR